MKGDLEIEGIGGIMRRKKWLSSRDPFIYFLAFISSHPLISLPKTLGLFRLRPYDRACQL